MKRTLLHLALLAATTATAGIPEPAAVFHGRVTVSPPNTAYVPATVAWTLNGNAEAVTVSQTQVIVVNTDTFYISRIPFETRRLTDNTPLTPTPNTLSLTAAATAYTRTGSVDGRPALLPVGAGTFNYGAANQGVVERIDLVIGEMFAEWSQRVFGMLVSQTGDADGDGRTNYQEYLDGTDPQDPTSRFSATSIVPVGAAAVTITWQSVVGRTYVVKRSLDLQNWTAISGNITATGPQTSFTDPARPASPRIFYRITANP